MRATTISAPTTLSGVVRSERYASCCRWRRCIPIVFGTRPTRFLAAVASCHRRSRHTERIDRSVVLGL